MNKNFGVDMVYKLRQWNTTENQQIDTYKYVQLISDTGVKAIQ